MMSREDASSLRLKVAQGCMDRFDGKRFDPGLRRDCVRLAAHALHLAGVKVAPLKGVRYANLAGAVRALKRTGFATLVEAMDATGLTRIAPAAAITGDILALPSDDVFGAALTVAVGNGRVLGWLAGDDAARPMQPNAYLAAWRLI